MGSVPWDPWETTSTGVECLPPLPRLPGPIVLSSVLCCRNEPFKKVRLGPLWQPCSPGGRCRGVLGAGRAWQGGGRGALVPGRP